MPRSEAQQVAGLRAADPARTIVLRPGDVPAMVLPGGLELVNADPEGTYDLWTAGGEELLKTGLDLGAVLKFMQGAPHEWSELARRLRKLDGS